MVLRGVFFVVVLPWSPKLARLGYSQAFSLGSSMWTLPPNIFCPERHVASTSLNGTIRAYGCLFLRSIAISCKIITFTSDTFYLCRPSCLVIQLTPIALTYLISYNRFWILSNFTSTRRIDSSARLRSTTNLV